jgi:hypothetical protein
MNEVLKVTVIATGFEAIEEEIRIGVTQQVRRSAERTNLREGFAPATSRSPSRPDARSEQGRDVGSLDLLITRRSEVQILPAQR